MKPRRENPSLPDDTPQTTRIARSLVARPTVRDFAEGVLLLLLFTLVLPPRLLLAASVPAADAHRLQASKPSSEPTAIPPASREEADDMAPDPRRRTIGSRRPESPLVKVTAALRSLPGSNAHLAMFMHVFERYVDGAKNPSKFEKRVFDRLSKSKVLTKERIAEVVATWEQTPEPVRRRLTPEPLRRLRRDQPLRPVEVFPALVQSASRLGIVSKGGTSPVDLALEGMIDPRVRDLFREFENHGDDPSFAKELAKTVIPPTIVQAFPLDEGVTTFHSKGKEPVAAKILGSFPHLEALQPIAPPSTSHKTPDPKKGVASSVATSESVNTAAQAALELPDIGKPGKGTPTSSAPSKAASSALLGESSLSAVKKIATSLSLSDPVSIMLGRHFVLQRTYAPKGLESPRVEFLPADNLMKLVVDPQYPDRPVGLDDIVWNVQSKLSPSSMVEKEYPVFEAPPLPVWGSGAFQPKKNELRPDRAYLMRICSGPSSLAKIAAAATLGTLGKKGASSQVVRRTDPGPIVTTVPPEEPVTKGSSIGASSPVPLVKPGPTESCSPMVPVTILLTPEDTAKVQAEKKAWEAVLETMQKPTLQTPEIYPGDALEATLGAESYTSATVSLIDTYLGPHAGPLPATLSHEKNKFGAYTRSAVKLDLPPILPPSKYIVVVELEGKEKGKTLKKTRIVSPALTVHPFAYRVDFETFRVVSTQDGSPDDFMTYFGINRDGRRHARKSSVYHDVHAEQPQPRGYREKDRYVLWNPDEGKKLQTDYPKYKPKSEGAPEVWRPVRHFLSVAVTNWEWDEGNYSSQAVLDEMSAVMEEIGDVLEDALQEYVESLLESVFGGSAFQFAAQFMTIVAEQGWEAAIQWLVAKGTAAAAKVAADVQAALAVLAGISEAVWVVSAMALAVIVMIVVLYAAQGSAPDPIGSDLFFVTASELQLLTSKKSFVASAHGAELHTDEEVVWCSEEANPAAVNLKQFCYGKDGVMDEEDVKRILASPNPNFSEYRLDFRIRGGKRFCVKDRNIFQTNTPGVCSQATLCDPFAIPTTKDAWDWHTGPCAAGKWTGPYAGS